MGYVNKPLWMSIPTDISSDVGGLHTLNRAGKQGYKAAHRGSLRIVNCNV